MTTMYTTHSSSRTLGSFGGIYNVFATLFLELIAIVKRYMIETTGTLPSIVDICLYTFLERKKLRLYFARVKSFNVRDRALLENRLSCACNISAPLSWK